jgi:hypothetical protein
VSKKYPSLHALALDAVEQVFALAVQTEDPHYLVEGSKKYPSLQVK